MKQAKLSKINAIVRMVLEEYKDGRLLEECCLLLNLNYQGKTVLTSDPLLEENSIENISNSEKNITFNQLDFETGK